MQDERITRIGKLYETNFSELGLEIVFVRGYASPMGDTLLYNLKYISQYDKKRISSILDKIAIFHHATLKLIDTKEAHFGIFDTTRATQTIPLSKYLYDREITIGLDNYGRQVKLDFNEIPHLLIAGTTGSGKSVLLHNIICNLITHYNKSAFRKKLQMIICDPKGTELNAYRNVKNTTFIDDTRKSIRALSQIVEIMEERSRRNHYEHEIFVIIDELADLMLTSKFEVEESLVRIAQRGRSVGIHLIVATQNPKVEVCSGLIKANMPYRICLKTASMRESMVVLDKKGSEELKGKGDSIVRLNNFEIRCQIAYPTSDTINKVVMMNRG